MKPVQKKNSKKSSKRNSTSQIVTSQDAELHLAVKSPKGEKHASSPRQLPSKRSDPVEKAPEKAVSASEGVKKSPRRLADRKKEKSYRTTVATTTPLNTSSVPDTFSTIRSDVQPVIPIIETTSPSPPISPHETESRTDNVPSSDLTQAPAKGKSPQPELNTGALNTSTLNTSALNTSTLNTSAINTSASPGSSTVSEKVLRVKTGIVGILREIHLALTELNQTVTLSEDLNTIITCVKLVKLMKEELSKSGEVITMGVYNVSHPTKTDNKLELLKGHWQSNAEAVNFILKDIAKELGVVTQPDQLVYIFKLLKGTIDEAKFSQSQLKK